MSRLLFVLPSVGGGDAVRVDSASGSDSPAEITPADGGPAIVGSLLHAGTAGQLPRVLGPSDGTATLYLKPLDYRGAVAGDPVTLTGIDLDAAPSDGSGASGTPNDWLSVYKFVANQLITNDGTGGAPPGYTLALFSHGDDPPPRGTAFTWDGAGTITANVDLICDVSAKVVVAAHDAGGGYAYGGEILFNDDNTGPGYSYDVFQLPVPDNPGRSAVSTFMIPGLAMTAGQTLRMILQSEVPETVKIQECVMTVSRRG